MKFVRFLSFLLFIIPTVVFGAKDSDFQTAAKLLTAAKNGDTQTIQKLISSGADINYKDTTGMSLVCTALMNNDKKSVQVLQMYGADASQCDTQIKKYKKNLNKSLNGEDNGFFSGLSSSHILALSAGGVALVAGGLALFTDVFKFGNKNGGSSSGNRHHDDDDDPTVKKGSEIPYGPAYIKAGYSDAAYAQNIQGIQSVYSNDISYMNKMSENTKGIINTLQNYLLVMRGYSPLAHGYMGQHTFREDNHKPVEVQNEANGGKPVTVALITDNGVNPSGSAINGTINYADSTAVTSVVQTTNKYDNYDQNNKEKTGFDFSESGTSLNPFASGNDSVIAKVVAGWNTGRADADLTGFVPNGQLAIYRTENSWKKEDTKSKVGSYDESVKKLSLKTGERILKISTVSEGQTTEQEVKVNIVSETTYLVDTIKNNKISINGTTYDVANDSQLLKGTTSRIEVSVNEDICTTPDVCVCSGNNCTITFNTCTDGFCTIVKGGVTFKIADTVAFYKGTDGIYYFNTIGGNSANVAYSIDGTNALLSEKHLEEKGVYNNFAAMLDAKKHYDIIANTSLLPASKNIDYLTTKLFTKELNLDTECKKDGVCFLQNKINEYYGKGLGDKAPGTAIHEIFGTATKNTMFIFPAGDFMFGKESGQTIDTLDATFENYIPLLYGNNIDHNFMTVVAVNHSDPNQKLSQVKDISTYYAQSRNGTYGPLYLSMWEDGNGNTMSSRKCGVAGTGANGVDPWCFAASGANTEIATAAAAGAVASLKSAFDYMSTKEIFTLMALTADGAYLGTLPDGTNTKANKDSLVSYLKQMYALPIEYNEDWLSADQYLEAFKDVYGYGLINLERATTPGKSIYYYDEGKIVSAAGNAYWRASTNTALKSSNVLGLNGVSVKSSYYDILSSVDGSLTLPRIWTNEFTLGTVDKHGLYMGDVLGEFNVDTKTNQSTKIGNVEIDMALSPRAYVDNMNGLDNLNIKFTTDTMDVSAGYQRYLTNGESRFTGRANSILSLASRAIKSDATYKNGNWSFGASAFSGSITDETLLENDPTISAQFEPGRLGFVNGGAADVSYLNDQFSLNMSVGTMHETNTLLGSYSDGLLSLGNGDTVYVDTVAEYKPFENVKLSLRGTFANTKANSYAGLVSDVTNIQSNSFALGADLGNFSFTASLPLAAVKGNIFYDYADYSIIETDTGSYDLVINDAHREALSLVPKNREMRFNASYKHSLGDFTDAGIGFIYRVNPNNISQFGNESIFMLKIHHRLGI